jgi:hypothetical protein
MPHPPHTIRHPRPSPSLRLLVIVASALSLPRCGDSGASDAPAAPFAGGGQSSAGGTAADPGGGDTMGAVTLPGGDLTPEGDPGGGEPSGGGENGPSEAEPGAEPPVTCPLPTTFSWTSSQPLITPKPPAGRTFASIKDPSIVFYEGKYHVFASVYETTAGADGYKSVYLSFSDFSQADAAEQIYMPNLPTGSTVAPEVFYFAPQNRWYLIYQWGARYSTNDDISNPNGWSAPQPLLAGEPPNALDFWVICDDADCHLFFSRDDGVLYKSKTPVSNFPSFSGYDVVMSEPSPGLLFEASNVYKVDGSNEYLMLVEAYGPRYFRSWKSDSLDGPWAPLADTQQNPFAGAANVTFDGPAWSADVSHGELIRSGVDQKLTINTCNMQYLYQGTAPGFQGDYNLIPYRLGLITAR